LGDEARGFLDVLLLVLVLTAHLIPVDAVDRLRVHRPLALRREEALVDTHGSLAFLEGLLPMALVPLAPFLPVAFSAPASLLAGHFQPEFDEFVRRPPGVQAILAEVIATLDVHVVSARLEETRLAE